MAYSLAYTDELSTHNLNHLLHVHSGDYEIDLSSGEGVSDISMKSGDIGNAKDGLIPIGQIKSTSAIQVTNHITGKAENDGLLIQMHNNNASITNREDGSLSFQNNGSLLVKLEQTDNLSITGGNLAMNNNQIRFRGSGDQNHRINYTNDNGLDGLHIQGNKGVEIGTENYGTVMTVKDRMHVKRGSHLYTGNPHNNPHNYSKYTAYIENIGGSGAGLLIQAGSNQDYGYPLLVQNHSDDDDDDKDILAVSSRGNVGIGTAYPNQNYKLDVAGKIRGCKVYANNLGGWCDYIFEDDHQLMPLDSLERFVKTNKHLPGIPTEAEVMENGLDLGEMNKKLLEKVEELSLYIIEQEKRIKNLEKQLKQ